MIAKAKSKKVEKLNKNERFWFFVFPILISLVGLLFVFESSSIRSFNESGDSFHYFKLQAVWIFLGVCTMAFFSVFDYHKLYYLAFFSMMFTIGLLALVLIPSIGSTGGGARSWIDLGGVNFQPTELAKFSVIIYLSSWFNHKDR